MTLQVNMFPSLVTKMCTVSFPGNTDGHKQLQPHQSPQQQQHQKNSIASPQVQDVRMENPGRGRGGRGRGRGAGRGNNR